MTDDRSLERAARSWLEEGPTRAPDRAVSGALAQIETTRQERDLRIPWRFRTVSPLARLATAIVLAVVAIGGTLYVIGGPRGPGGVGGPQSPTPSTLVSPTPTASPVRPTPTPLEGACRLVTSAEAEQIAGQPGTGARPSLSGTGDVTTCIYQDGGGGVVLRLTYTIVGGEAELDGLRNAPGMEVVPDVGDDALFATDTGTLYVRMGDALVLIAVGLFHPSPADRLEVARELAPLIIERM
jgi:hypothetical protein